LIKLNVQGTSKWDIKVKLATQDPT